MLKFYWIAHVLKFWYITKIRKNITINHKKFICLQETTSRVFIPTDSCMLLAGPTSPKHFYKSHVNFFLIFNKYHKVKIQKSCKFTVVDRYLRDAVPTRIIL